MALYESQCISSRIDGSTVTPTDDIATWLECAGLHQSYTTIAEVLADSGVLSALMESTNAVDYLVRSTTWASAICADELAMNYIGKNNYCADILLADNTWASAICNSAYFEQVLNAKVPTMTSNTTPSGEAFASHAHSAPYMAYMAFDNNSETRWNGSNLDSTEYLGYKFTSAQCVKRIYIDVLHRCLKTAKLQGSNDGSTWTDIADITMPDVATTQSHHEGTFNINNNNSYIYYRLNMLESWIAKNYSIWTMQFYGRSDLPPVDDRINAKADISAIAPEELGSTSSRAYAVGEHFYKNGKFCTCIQAIAQGAQFTLGTNYVERTVADNLLKKISTSITFTSGVSIQESSSFANLIIIAAEIPGSNITFEPLLNSGVKTGYKLTARTSSMAIDTMFSGSKNITYVII